MALIYIFVPFLGWSCHLSSSGYIQNSTESIILRKLELQWRILPLGFSSASQQISLGHLLASASSGITVKVTVTLFALLTRTLNGTPTLSPMISMICSEHFIIMFVQIKKKNIIFLLSCGFERKGILEGKTNVPLLAIGSNQVFFHVEIQIRYYNLI